MWTKMYNLVLKNDKINDIFMIENKFRDKELLMGLIDREEEYVIKYMQLIK